jgi:euchromatic histone-lysine N-methyltransferase
MTQDKEAATTRGYFGPRKRVKVKVPAHLQMKIASTCALGSKVKLDDEVASSLEDDDILKALVVHEGNLELFLNSYSGLTSARCQTKHGSQNADARSKFKMLCRRFEFVCRALVQAVEQNSLKIRRIDLQADKVIRKLPGFTKSGPIVGQVPGVQVGDEFLYRVQLAIVGLHLAYQGGIDTTVYRNGERIAISIVASGGYPDELSSSGELIYSGSGGKPAGKKDHEDQKLERGNLALKNCIKTKTPVRVIYGFKAQNTRVGSHSRAREVSTFTYDGLYQVLDFWMDGQPGSRVFKYKLKKIPGQPELPMHIAEGMRKSKTRPGQCEIDISQGKEAIPICVINTVDAERPAPFRYTTRIRYPFELIKKRHQGCDCTNGCSDSASCACAVKNGGEIPFNLNGAIVNEKPLIFECGPSCKCPPSCQNKVSQHGLKIPLEVFRTTKTGWGVRSLRSISSGSFICEYVGELLYGNEADERRNSDFLFDIGLNHGDENFFNGLLSNVSDMKSSSSSSQILGDVGFTIDAAECGNIGRFINHSCSPNLYAQNVLWDHDDLRIPHIMFFAAETIPPLQELTYDYNYEIDHVEDMNGRIKFKVCQCGSPRCSGRLY